MLVFERLWLPYAVFRHKTRSKKKALINTQGVRLIIRFDTASIELEHLLGCIWNLHNGPFFCCTHPPRLDDVDKPMCNYSKTPRAPRLCESRRTSKPDQGMAVPSVCHRVQVLFLCSRQCGLTGVPPPLPRPTSTPRICRYINIRPGLLLHILAFGG